MAGARFPHLRKGGLGYTTTFLVESRVAREARGLVSSTAPKRRLWRGCFPIPVRRASVWRERGSGAWCLGHIAANEAEGIIPPKGASPGCSCPGHIAGNRWRREGEPQPSPPEACLGSTRPPPPSGSTAVSTGSLALRWTALQNPGFREACRARWWR